MKHRSRTLLALALAAVAFAARAQAPHGPPERPPGPPPDRVFISPSGEPFRPGPGAPDPFGAWFARVDANHDGAIDRAEFRADAQSFFKVLDANGDGRIDGFEIAAYERKIAPELIAAAEGGLHQPGEREEPPGGRRGRGPGGHGDRGGREGPGGPRGRGGRAFVALLDEPEPVSGADFDLDFRVSAAEWLRATDRRFDMLDTKKAGKLTRESLLARFGPPPKPKR